MLARGRRQPAGDERGYGPYGKPHRTRFPTAPTPISMLKEIRGPRTSITVSRDVHPASHTKFLTLPRHRVFLPAACVALAASKHAWSKFFERKCQSRSVRRCARSAACISDIPEGKKDAPAGMPGGGGTGGMY